jgi:hypothetical protein
MQQTKDNTPQAVPHRAEVIQLPDLRRKCASDRAVIRRVLNSLDRARYQALCLNCNQAKGRGQECQHQREARALMWQNLT